MRYGVALVTVVAGLASVAFVLTPLALRHTAATRLPPVFDGTTSVYAVPLAGGTPRRVLRLHGQWAFPVATADGRALLLERPRLDETGLWRVPLDGSTPTHVRELKRFTAPVVTSNGFVAAEKQWRPGTGWRIDLLVRAHGRVVWQRQMPFPFATGVSVAADGKRVAAVRMRRLELVTPHRIRLLAADAAQFWPPHWTRDDSSLLYWTTRGQLAVVDVASGARRVLVRGRYFEDALSRDGRTVYFLGMNDAVSIPK